MFSFFKRTKFQPDFENMVSLGREIFEANPDALHAYVNGLARKVQHDQFMDFVVAKEHEAPERDLGQFFGLNCCNYQGHRVFEKMKISGESEEHNHIVDIDKQVVFSSPWRTDRLIKTMALIDKDKGRPWEMDNNHYVSLLLPFGLAWFENGFHSGMTGILKRDGVVKPKEVYDFSRLYDDVHTDGYNFYYTETGGVFRKVDRVEFAAIYELGRLLAK